MERKPTTDFDVLYGTYAQAIYRFAFLKTGSKEVAEDVTMETFFRYYKHSTLHSKIENKKAFLYQIARNYIIDWYRKEGTIKSISLDENIYDPVAHQDIMKEALTRELYQEVRQAMKFLKKEYEDIIFLYFVEDLTTKEIAKVLNVTENTTRVTLHRAIASLKKKIILSDKGI